MRATALALAGVLSIACGEARGQPTSYADEWLGQPVDDATFQNYLEFFVVDHEEPLDAELLDSRETMGFEEKNGRSRALRGSASRSLLRDGNSAIERAECDRGLAWQ